MEIGKKWYATVIEVSRNCENGSDRDEQECSDIGAGKDGDSEKSEDEQGKCDSGASIIEEVDECECVSDEAYSDEEVCGLQSF